MDTLTPLPAMRDDFPALVSRRVYLDNAATTHQPRAVIRAVSEYVEHVHGTPAAVAVYADARARVAKNLGALAENVVFCGGATQAIQMVADGFDAIGSGDEIVVSSAEHIANLAPWQRLAERCGGKLRMVDVDSNGTLALDAFRSTLSDRTKFVAITHVSNALGTMMPVREIILAAREAGARVLIDGAQAIAHGAVDFDELGADFYVFSGHKVFAPTGIGVLLATHDMLQSMQPHLFGAQAFAGFTLQSSEAAKAPQRFEGGTSNVAGAVGLAAALDYVDSQGWDVLDAQNRRLLDRLDNGLSAIGGVRVLADSAASVGLRSFVAEGHESVAIHHALAERGIDVRAGHLSAATLLHQFGTTHAVRVSVAPYNSDDDIDRFLAALREAVR